MLAIRIEITVYTETLNITNELALPFCAWAEESLGNGANGTDPGGAIVVVVVVDGIALVSGCTGLGFAWFIELLSGIGAIGAVEAFVGGIDGSGSGADWSGRGANGTVGAICEISLRTPVSCGANGTLADGAIIDATVVDSPGTTVPKGKTTEQKYRQISGNDLNSIFSRVEMMTEISQWMVSGYTLSPDIDRRYLVSTSFGSSNEVNNGFHSVKWTMKPIVYLLDPKLDATKYLLSISIYG